MKCVFLISCVKTKKLSAAPAEEIYISYRFRRMRELVKATGCRWFILSAKHNLLAPDKTIEYYNQTLNGKSSRVRKAWAEKVKEQMDNELPCAETIVILAGKIYYEHLMPYLEERFGHANIKIPMKGMRNGEQLSWLKSANVEDILPR